MKLEILDAGCRYGLHPSFNVFKDCAEFHMFDADSGEISRLQEKYKSEKNMHFYPLALYSKPGTMRFNNYAHKGLGSLANVNANYVKDKGFMKDSFESTGSMEVGVESIDSLFRGRTLHFIKLDTEGSELEILKGGEETLKQTLALRIETHFAPLYKDCPLFGDIHAYLLEQGFELLNLDYDGRGHALSPYTMPERYGVLVGCDGIWIRQQSSVLEFVNQEREKEVIFYALFLMSNNASDVALNTLHKAEEAGMKFEKYSEDSHFILLDSLIQKLFKDMSTLPWSFSAGGGGGGVF